MDAFTGEIRAFGFQFTPQDWMLCNGATLPVNQYAALFSIIGNTFGGDGRTNFKLPNIPGTVLNGQGAMPGGNTYAWGQMGGVETVQLNTATTPAHTHNFEVVFVQGGGTKETTVPTANSSFLSNVF